MPGRRVGSNADDYADRGAAFAEAWEILFAGCTVPPSLEQFEHIVTEKRRSDPNATLSSIARAFVKGYYRTPMR